MYFSVILLFQNAILSIFLCDKCQFVVPT